MVRRPSPKKIPPEPARFGKPIKERKRLMPETETDKDDLEFARKLWEEAKDSLALIDKVDFIFPAVMWTLASIWQTRLWKWLMRKRESRVPPPDYDETGIGWDQIYIRRKKTIKKVTMLITCAYLYKSTDSQLAELSLLSMMGLTAVFPHGSKVAREMPGIMDIFRQVWLGDWSWVDEEGMGDIKEPPTIW